MKGSASTMILDNQIAHGEPDSQPDVKKLLFTSLIQAGYVNPWEQEENMTEPKECRMVVGIADIAGFAKACESKTDLETFTMLATFYSFVGNVVGKADGTVIKFMGDSALVVFPEDKDRQAVASLQELTSTTDGAWSEFGEKCTVRTKAHVGSVALGPMGPDNRLDVIGNTLNQLFRMPWNGPELSDELKQLMEQ